MPSRFDRDEQLDSLERELGPTLRGALHGHTPRPEFAMSLRDELRSLPSADRTRRPRLVPVRAWAALAAVFVVGIAAFGALFAARAQTASAEEVLSQVQAEAVTMLSTSGGPCESTPGAGAGVAVFQTSGGDASAPGKAGPVTLQNGGQAASPNDLSDKLAQALGVSGDRVREAMVATMRSVMPTSLPPDPMAIVAEQLGLPRQQVCSAFFDPHSSFGGIVIHRNAGAASNEEFNVRTTSAQPALDLGAATPAQLADTAHRLGVSPERLADAVHAAAAAPVPTPPAPPKEDELIATFAQNLGVSTDKVRAAITEVEGPHVFYLGVPGFAKR